MLQNIISDDESNLMWAILQKMEYMKNSKAQMDIDWKKIAEELQTKGIALVIEKNENNIVKGKIEEKVFTFSGSVSGGRGCLSIKDFCLGFTPNHPFIQVLSSIMKSNPFCEYKRRDMDGFSFIEWENNACRYDREIAIDRYLKVAYNIFYPPVTYFEIQYE
jgi:hypothetical protein